MRVNGKIERISPFSRSLFSFRHELSVSVMTCPLGYMNGPLSKIIEKYAAFEAEVNAYTTKIFQKSCSACNGACCRPEICEESFTSPFLKRLRQRFAPDAVFSNDRGWLKSTGCALPVGRPPGLFTWYAHILMEILQN